MEITLKYLIFMVQIFPKIDVKFWQLQICGYS